MSLHPLFQQQLDTIFGGGQVRPECRRRTRENHEALPPASTPYDPYALAREQVRSHAIETAAYVRQVDDTTALCRRVGEQLDSVHALVVPVPEG